MPKQAPGEPINNKLPLQAPGDPITNFLNMTQLGLKLILQLKTSNFIKFQKMFQSYHL